MKKRTSPDGKSEKAAKPAQEPVSPSKALRIPSILLEGDEPMPSPRPEAAKTQAPGREASAEPRTPEPDALPEAYGTGKLLLVARDPHSLYVHWDLASEQQSHYQTLALNRHLNLRVYNEAVEGHVLKEVQASRDSQHSFIHVEGAGGRYVVELGYYPRSGRWVSLAVSAPVETPPVSLAPDATVQFAAMPPEMPPVHPPGAAPEATADTAKERRAPAALETLKRLALPTIAWLPGLEPGGAPATPLAELVRRTLPQFEPQPPMSAPGWSPAQERAFAEVLRLVEKHQDYANSLALAESVLVQLRRGAAPSVEAKLPFLELLRIPEGISSPSGGEQPAPRGFWFNVNAELVIYGATEPEACVVIGGKAIQLRPDGTFSLRFALPDGNYELTAAATSAQGDSRQARLAFSRHTEYQGQVGTAPGKSSLKPLS